MASRDQLEAALRNAHAAGDVSAANQIAAAIKAGQFDQDAQTQQGVAALTEDSQPVQRTIGDILTPLLQIDFDDPSLSPAQRSELRDVYQEARSLNVLVDPPEGSFTGFDLARAGFDVETGGEDLKKGISQRLLDLDRRARTAREERPGAIEDIGATAGDVATELAAAVNRGAVNIADFLTTDQINAILSLSGSEARVPAIQEAPFIQEATTGEFMRPGLGREVVRGAGEAVGPGAAAGTLFRSAAQQIPTILPRAKTFAEGLISQLGKTTAAADVGFSAASGAGAEVGRDIGGEEGAIVGGILAPVSIASGQGLFNMLQRGARGISSFFRGTQGMSDEGASTLLAEAMVREGLSPDDVARRLADLGPEAVPADVGTAFRRQLREAANKIPLVEGQAKQALQARQAASGERILSSFDDATGTASLSVDDEIVRINNVARPKIDRLYSEARIQGEENIGGPRVAEGYSSLGVRKPETKLERLLSGENISGSASRAAQRELDAKIFAGEEVTKIDMVDATKRALDDQIKVSLRQGADNKARLLVKTKNILLDEADNLVPKYAEARSFFAGKAELENAAELGGMFFRSRLRDISAQIKNYGESEKKFYLLGAKKAILDKIDDTNITSDLAKRLFGKNGDTAKLKSLFPDKASFNRFNDTLKQEAEFIITRNEITGNSTTAKQILDVISPSQMLNDTKNVISQGGEGVFNILGRTLAGLEARKGSEQNLKALDQAAAILLSKDISPQKISSILKSGQMKLIEKELRSALRKDLESPGVGAVSSVSLIEAQEDKTDKR